MSTEIKSWLESASLGQYYDACSHMAPSQVRRRHAGALLALHGAPKHPPDANSLAMALRHLPLHGSHQRLGRGRLHVPERLQRGQPPLCILLGLHALSDPSRLARLPLWRQCRPRDGSGRPRTLIRTDARGHVGRAHCGKER